MGGQGRLSPERSRCFQLNDQRHDTDKESIQAWNMEA